MADPKTFAGIARAPFLTLPFTLVAAGAAAAAYDGGFSWLRTVMALVGLVALHVAANVFNEVSDMRTGIDEHTRMFRREPEGFWLPECGYAPGIDKVLADKMQ